MAAYLPRSVEDIQKIPPAVYKNLFVEYLELRLLDSVCALLLQHNRIEDHTSFFVSAQDLIDFDPTLGLHKHPTFERKYHSKGTVKRQVHVRVTHVPPLPAINKRTISDVRSTDFHQFIQLTGTVVRTGSVRVLEVSKEYQCTRARCGYKFKVLADPEQNNNIPVPRMCPGPKPLPGGAAGVCAAGGVEEVLGSKECVDYQEIKIQDKMELLHLGSVPRTITVVLEADLADRYNAGDDVVVVGNIIRRWAPVMKGARCQIELAVRANSVKVLNSNEEYTLLHQNEVSRFQQLWDQYNEQGRPYTCRDEIVRAVCPQLHGMYFVKLCLLLTIIGGSTAPSGQVAAVDGDTSNGNNGSRDQGRDANEPSSTCGQDTGVSRRTQSHLLIVGDPGTGKSQLLRFAASLLPRSVLTTGVGTTGAGLTCTAVRDGADWVLEAGALVLANEGVCCIDEFVSIKEADRACIHEAMEQQTISVAKAGLLVKLNTRATVIAVSNPKGSYDVGSDLTTNTAIASPLLSRFDLVLVLLDYPDKDYDKRISTFLLQQAVGMPQLRHNTGDKPAISDGFWDFDTLRAYVLYCRESLSPRMGKEAQFVLMRYYQLQRQSDDRSSARTTVRLLESLMRLAQAHAKLMFRCSVQLEDAVMAVACLELSASASVLVQGAHSALHADFPADPEEAYRTMETETFKKIHYSRERLAEELGYPNASIGNSVPSKGVDIFGTDALPSVGVKRPRVNHAGETDTRLPKGENSVVPSRNGADIAGKGIVSTGQHSADGWEGRRRVVVERGRDEMSAPVYSSSQVYGPTVKKSGMTGNLAHVSSQRTQEIFSRSVDHPLSALPTEDREQQGDHDVWGSVSSDQELIPRYCASQPFEHTQSFSETISLVDAGSHSYDQPGVDSTTAALFFSSVVGSQQSLSSRLFEADIEEDW